jgi:hypothetical protein
MPLSEETETYIVELIRSLDRELDVEILSGKDLNRPFVYEIRTEKQGEVFIVSFTRWELEDFDNALTQHRDTNYFVTIEGNIKFRIYIELGKRGLLPNLPISNEIINEKREWKTIYTTVSVRFAPKMTEALSSGLQNLLTFLDSLIKEHEDLPLEDIEIDRDGIQTIYNHYKKTGSLDEDGATFESIQYLKAAAVARIIQLEKRKTGAPITRIRQAIDEEIYSIVEKLRNPPFLDVKLPGFMVSFGEACVAQRDAKPAPLGSGKADLQFLLSSPPVDQEAGIATQAKTQTKEYDVFVSHASEDKVELVRPLADELTRLGLRVWLDEKELTIGDSIRRTIEKGLSSSRYGIVVISPYFLSKYMPQKELDALISLESEEGRKLILPIWHNVDRSQIKEACPLLLDTWAARSSDGIKSVAKEVLKATGKACPFCRGGPIFENRSAGEAGCLDCKKTWTYVPSSE